ncbi:MAG: hypothetical protein ACRDM7_15915 [Thermoleophilaceae bacterium]
MTLKWDYDNTAAHVSGGTCSDRTFTSDTAGFTVYCEVADNSSGATYGYPVTIKVDRTAPSVTASPARPPDYGGWFNHPVSVNFAGQDPISKVAFCTGGTYAGPDGATVTVGGSCTDVAGNVSFATFTLSYDATAPRAPAVDAMPGDHKIDLTWTTSPDSQAEVVRTGGDESATVVYSGPGGAFTDRGLKNERRYRYVVTLIDQAGNRAAGSTSTVPTAANLLLPPKGQRVRVKEQAVTLPLLVWTKVRKARYYNVQVFRKGQKILSAWPERPRLQLRRKWRYRGKTYHLLEGRYCWHVWPGFGKRSEHRYGKRLGRSCFRVTR